jgi:hypothetical protein
MTEATKQVVRPINQGSSGGSSFAGGWLVRLDPVDARVASGCQVRSRNPRHRRVMTMLPTSTHSRNWNVEFTA